jgi:hypothetical protein
MILVSALMLPVTIVRFYMGWFQMLVLDLPLVLATFGSIFSFYLFAQRVRDRRSWKRSLALLPMLIGAGIALTLINTKAVIEALFRVPTAFARTAKYAVGDHRRQTLARARYRLRSGFLPFAEILLGCFFLFLVAYSIDTFNFLALPFLLMFVGGYFWAGFGTLIDDYRERLRWERRRAAAEAQPPA